MVHSVLDQMVRAVAANLDHEPENEGLAMQKVVIWTLLGCAATLPTLHSLPSDATL